MELTSEGRLVVISPTGAKTSWRNSKLVQRLANWADANGRGVAFDSNAGFTLPNGAKRSPEAAWVRLESWEDLTDEEQERFAPLCPDFVAELRSPQDNLSNLQVKMQEYIDNGARLGWLLDPETGLRLPERPGDGVPREAAGIKRRRGTRRLRARPERYPLRRPQPTLCKTEIRFYFADSLSRQLR